MAATAAAAALSAGPAHRWRLLSLPLPPSAPVVTLSSPAATTHLCFGGSPSAGQSHHLAAGKARRWGGRAAAFAAKASAAGVASGPLLERWLLEPVGDGDSRHIGFQVPMPGAFEMASDVLTIGRLPDKVDVVIPVATVSGLHARLEKKEGNLLVTDLNSTNGTYVEDKRLGPGAVVTVSPGSCITFGDTHLAMFRVSKLQEEIPSSEPADSEIKTETEVLQTETTPQTETTD